MTEERKATPVHWPDVVRKSFDRSFWFFVALAAAMGLVCYLVLGEQVFREAMARNTELLGDLLPRVSAAQLMAGMLWVLIPRDRMSDFLNRHQGRRGLVLAAFAGAITPGGPASAFPFLLILASSGADRGILVSYITSWAILGVQRIIVWDIPFMGIDFSMLRLLVGLPLPILAGMLARRLPFSLSFADSPPPRGLEK